MKQKPNPRPNHTKYSAWRYGGVLVLAAALLFALWRGLAPQSGADAEQPASPAPIVEPETDPGADVWPGLGLAVVDTGEVGVGAVASPVGESDAETAENVLPDASLIELMDAFETLPPVARPETARRIAEGWDECWNHQPIEAEALDEAVARKVRADRASLVSLLSWAPESEESEAVIDAYSEIDPARLRAVARREILKKQAFCAGSQAHHGPNVFLTQSDWWRRAARLGDPAARYRFLNEAFSAGAWSGRAAQIAEDKQLILEILTERLARRDLNVIDIVGGIVEKGWFAPPNPVLGAAYLRAGLIALERPDLAGWRLKRDSDQARQTLRAVFRFNLRRMSSALDDAQRAESDRLAEAILQRGGR